MKLFQDRKKKQFANLTQDDVSNIEAKVRLSYEKSLIYKANPMNFQELDQIEAARRQRSLSKNLPMKREETNHMVK